jgi:S1-C subfamily serine protease
MRKILSAIFTFTTFSIRMASYAIIITIIAYATPQLHKAYLRTVVGSKVVMVTNQDPKKFKEGYYGGTGFYVKASSGKTYIVTNRHVCRNVSEHKEYMYVSSKNDSVTHKVKIVERYDSSDLCLLEAVPGIEGLTVGEMPEIDQHVAVIGHPNLQPKTFTDGDVVGMDTSQIAIGIIGQEGMQTEDCKFKDNRMLKIPTKNLLEDSSRNNKLKFLDTSKLLSSDAPKEVTVCFATNFVMITTALIWHGSSGSPVVDFYGRVVGVMYAIGEDKMWGRVITVADLKALLAKY